MAKLITLEEDGPLGPSGTQVWVDDEQPSAEEKPKKAPAKKQAASR